MAYFVLELARRKHKAKPSTSPVVELNKKPVEIPEDGYKISRRTEIQASYKGELPISALNAISDMFFKKIIHLILSGYVFSTPVGKLQLKRMRHSDKRVDFKKVRNPELYDNIFKDNPYTDVIIWDKADIRKPFLDGYDFKLTFHAERSIPHYEELRNINKSLGNV